MTGNDEGRAIELEVAVAGTPEQVWEAIATGPGISAWFVPTTVVGEPGGVITQDFGPGMLVEGRVQAWQPPHRFGFGEHAEPAPGAMAFEFLVEARDGGSCVVRLVNSGFGSGEEWDDQYDATENGWRIFLHILQLHLQRFAGQPATRVLAMAMEPGTSDADAIWTTARRALTGDGDVVHSDGDAVPPLDGTVTLHANRGLAFALDGPAPGTGLVAIEPHGGATAVSLWLAFYGPDAAALAERDGPRWQAWVDGLVAGADAGKHP